MSKVQNHFLRYEFKYLLDEKRKNLIEEELSHFIQLDPFVERFENKMYYVRSLYFDDPGYSFYYEKTDGLMHRQKFRIRTYVTDYDNSTPIMLELKGRYNNFVYKHRCIIEHTSELDKNVFQLVDHGADANNPIVKQFTYDRFKKKYHQLCSLIINDGPTRVNMITNSV